MAGLNHNELKFEFMRGTGPGGQHKNKTCSACRVTHLPTGMTAYADERSQKHSKKRALAALAQKLQGEIDAEAARRKKSRRDHAIHNEERIRTYDFQRGAVTDHRTGKTAPLKKVMGKGQIELLRSDNDY